jgi:cyclopropane fatty-acyl-phospholipid synthase-like methyltransferase
MDITANRAANRDQTSTGVKKTLELPWVYKLFQRLIQNRKAQRRFVDRIVSVEPGMKVLDIGCGPAEILEDLPEGIDYVGYDMESKYIEFARQKYGSRGRFFCQRVSEQDMPEPGTYDRVLAIGLIHHLNDDEAKKLFQLAAHALKPGGAMVTNDNAYIDKQSPIARYIISHDRGRHTRTPEGYTKLAGTVFSQIETTLVHDMMKVPYTSFFMKCIKPMPQSE